MSDFLVKNRFFVTRHIWFDDSNPSSWLKQKSDRLFIHGFPKEEKKIEALSCSSKVQETLVSDLSVEADELIKKCTKTVRNKINRSKKENIEWKIYQGNEIDNKLLNSFDEMYQNMYKEKGINGRVLPIRELFEYAKNNALLISVALINNKPMVYHSYVYDKLHCRLLHSCSEFRVASTGERNAIGRANKYLHWNDMLFFKNMGILEYDWGGISSYENPNGIDEFKMAFGGTYKKYYNIECDCSFKVRLYEKICSIIKR